MLVSLIIAIISVIVALWAKFSKSPEKILKISFVIVWAFVAFHYNFGNDYESYMRRFYDYQAYAKNIFDIPGIINCFKSTGHEIGWIILNLLFKPFGFFGFQIALYTFEFVVLYKMVVNYVHKDYYWVALSILVFDASLFMIACMSMMRQWLACMIFLLSSKYIIENKIYKYALLVLLAFTIHRSALLLLLVYFVRYIPMEKFSLKHFIIIVPVFLLWSYYSPTLISRRMDMILGISDFEESYAMYVNGDSKSSSLPIVGGVIVPFCLFLVNNRLSIRERIIVSISILSVIVLPMQSSSLSMLGRLAYYFGVYSIIAYPILSKALSYRNSLLPIALIFCCVIPKIIGFSSFFTLETWALKFSSYSTIFSVPWQ